MTTVDDSLAVQKTSNVLSAPTSSPPGRPGGPQPGVTTPTLSISLYNSTNTSPVYAYITGLAINNNNAVFLLQADGATAYYPANPGYNGTALSANCAIALGPPGSTINVTIPYIAGGRIWFCVGNPLTFLLNPGGNGPGLVEPSVSNSADPNYYLQWDFCEFTYNSAQLYANLSYVDFVSVPIALTLASTSGAVDHVSGIPSNGLQIVCDNLVAQNNQDGAGWNQLIIVNNGSILRALSPTNGIIFNNALFQNYWTNYVNSVWAYYISTPLYIDTQSSWGTVAGETSNDRTHLVFNGIGSFSKPSAVDIFGANSGAFAAQSSNTAELLNIGARLDAAFNRGTLLTDSVQPDNENVSTFYRNKVSNHYARIVHATNLDGRGYAFPYDDVTANGGVDQSGFVNDPSPRNLLVSVGGGNAYAKRDVQAAPKMIRRSVHWGGDVKEQVNISAPVVEMDRDMEKGAMKSMNESAVAPDFKLPPVLERLFGKYLTSLRASPFYEARLLPFFNFLNQLLICFLSLSMRAVLSRVFILVFVVLFYLISIFPRGADSAEAQSQKRILEQSLRMMNGTVALPGVEMMNGTLAFQAM